MKRHPHEAEYTTLSVRKDVADAIRRMAEQEQRPVYDLVQRCLYAYRRWRAEQSYIDERPDLADPTVDGLVTARVLDVPVAAPQLQDQKGD